MPTEILRTPLSPWPREAVLDSTWGGPLADMVRFVQEMKIVESENLIPLARVNGQKLAAGLRALEAKFAGLLSNVRGQGLYQGFSLATPELKNRLEKMALQGEPLLLLGAGADSIRLGPNLSVTATDIAPLMKHLEWRL